MFKELSGDALECRITGDRSERGKKVLPEVEIRKA
jgi:hypothetical protein